ncbi:MAG TPA: sialidase family protein [bacterium]|jgi:hypothetical protein
MKLKLLIIFIIAATMITGCPSSQNPKTADGGDTPTPTGAEQLGRYMFDTPTAFGEVGTIDLPRIAQYPGGAIHLVYLSTSGSNQQVKYTRWENDQFRPSTLLSTRTGRKPGAGFISALSKDGMVAYWINEDATGGQLLYRASSDGGRTTSLEKRLNERSQARWPIFLNVKGEDWAFFFVRTSDGWDLVVNRNYTFENEPVVDSTDSNPYNLQGAVDRDNVIIMWFERRENANGGRIVIVRSTDGGNTWERNYFLDGDVIPNQFNFFTLVHPYGEENLIHLIYSEDSMDEQSIYYCRSEDWGANFTIPVAMITSEESLTRSPGLIANSEVVLIATADADDEGPGIRYVVSEDGGESFEQPAVATRRISNPETISGVIDQNEKVMLVWDDLSMSDEAGKQLYYMTGQLRGR